MEDHILEKIQESIVSAKKIGITVHTDPDGDSIGSMIALALFLLQQKKNVSMYSIPKFPDSYIFLPGSKEVKTTYSPSDKLDVLIVLDSGNEKRVSEYRKFDETVPLIINIDHHKDNSRFGDINWIGNYAAVGEMIYEYGQKFNLEITREIARCLYVSLYTDTGGFRFSNTASNTMYVAGKLLESGINVQDVTSRINDNKKLEELKVLGRVLDCLQVDSSGSIAWSVQPGIDFDITIEIIDYIRMIQSVEVAVLFKETEKDKYKVSFRSKSNIDVSEIARHFGGGGHFGAAGAVLEGDRNTVVSRVIDYIKACIHK